MKVEEIPRKLSPRTVAALPVRESFWRRVLALGQQVCRASRRRPKSLRLCESVSLGDRRFVAVVAYQQARFLVGGTSASLVLLAQLDSDSERAATPEPCGPCEEALR